MTLLDVWTDDRLDQTSELFFKYPSTDSKASLLGVDQDVSYDGREWYVAEQNDERNDADVSTVIRCVALWYRLGERIRVGSTVLESTTCQEGLTTILASTGWTVGPLTASGGSAFSYEDQDQTVLALVRGWATVCDKVVMFDTANRTVDLVDVDDRGTNTGMGFRYGRNLKSIKRRVQPPDVTRLYPFGRDDLDIAGVNGGEVFIEDYGFYTAQGMTESEARERYRKDEVWSNSDIVDESALLAAGQTRLAERASALVEYQTKVVDLTELIGVNQRVGLGDTVRVSDSELGFDVSTTVVRLVHYPTEPWRDQVELAYLYDPAKTAGARNSRPKSGLTWELFQSRSSRIVLRNNNTWIANRIGVSFSGAAEAVYGYDLTFTGVGTSGTLSASAVDAETGELEHAIESVEYAAGETKHITWSWSHDSSDSNDDLNGQKDYRIRIQAIPTGGGPSASAGVDIEQFDSRFWILARGAVKRTPTAANSIRYDYTGGPQEFVVPDGVTQITMDVNGSKGSASAANSPGLGGRVVGTMEVVAGSTLKVVVGGTGTGASAASQTAVPSLRGGSGDGVSGASGHAGGGGSGVFPEGATLTTEGWLIAGGAGGNGQIFGGGSRQTGGDGGFFSGQDPATLDNGDGDPTTYPGGRYPGNPADQYLGGGIGNYDTGAGAASLPGASGETGGNGTGGTGGNATNSFTFPPGGGGGGYNGGAGGGSDNTSGNGHGGGGGGGCGYAHPDVFDVEIFDGANDEAGYVIISWDDPLA